MVLTDFFHCFRKVLPGGSICYSFHGAPPVPVQETVRIKVANVNIKLQTNKALHQIRAMERPSQVRACVRILNAAMSKKAQIFLQTKQAMFAYSSSLICLLGFFLWTMLVHYNGKIDWEY
jgi:fructose/tagatose bisphosphate aldolase